MDVTQAREPEVHRSTPEAELALWKQRYGCSADDADADADAGGAGDAAGPAPGSAPAADHLGKKRGCLGRGSPQHREWRDGLWLPAGTSDRCIGKCGACPLI